METPQVWVLADVAPWAGLRHVVSTVVDTYLSATVALGAYLPVGTPLHRAVSVLVRAVSLSANDYLSRALAA